MADGLKVMRIGEISWTIVANDNTEVQFVTDGYYAPQGKARLLSPQRIFNNQQGILGHYRGDEDKLSLWIDGLPTIEIPYNISSGLPIANGTPALSGLSANISLLTIDLSMGKILFLNGIIILGIWGYNKFSLNCVISLLPHKSFLLLQNSLFPCAKFVNLPRPVVAPREHG